MSFFIVLICSDSMRFYIELKYELIFYNNILVILFLYFYGYIDIDRIYFLLVVVYNY